MKFLVIAVLLLILSGCWLQDEMVRVQINGDISMAMIVTPDFEHTTPKEVESKARSYEGEMRKAGWKLSKSTMQLKDGEYNLHYLMTGNLHQVSLKTSFYEITRRNSKEVSIKFLTPEVEGVKVHRQLYFDYSIANTATVFNQNRSLVQEVRGVNEDDIYTISL